MDLSDSIGEKSPVLPLDEITVTDLSNEGDGDLLAKSELNSDGGKKYSKKKNREPDPFPGSVPIPMDKIKKYKRGHKVLTGNVRTQFHKETLKNKDSKIRDASRVAALAEFLLPELPGYIKSDDDSDEELTQQNIAKSVDVFNAEKYFELHLKQFGPYNINYTRNGRFLLMGGKKGHIAALDWQTKNLLCEFNVMEVINDVKWFHIETMFAVAQKQWTYVYDNQGIEIHCIKALDSVLKMEFLPYHFLLCSSNDKGYISWLDISIGQKVSGYTTGLGRMDVMCQNPQNAIIHTGHSNGTVSLWSPNIKQPLVKMLCHGSGTRSVAVDQTGLYMASSGVDRKLKIWDLRTYKAISNYNIGIGASELSFSQRGSLAASLGSVVEIYEDVINKTVDKAYINHRCPGTVAGLQFCPYEDVLGVGHQNGFCSLLAPGTGEPNFDALEANPYASKKQRQQMEVKLLLEKVQPEMISLDNYSLGKVDTETVQETLERKKNTIYLKPEKIDFEPRYKKKGRSKTGKIQKRKQGVIFESKQKILKDALLKQKQQMEDNIESIDRNQAVKSVLNRFKQKS